jgi:hypothetical protein
MRNQYTVLMQVGCDAFVYEKVIAANAKDAKEIAHNQIGYGVVCGAWWA